MTFPRVRLRNLWEKMTAFGVEPQRSVSLAAKGSQSPFSVSAGTKSSASLSLSSSASQATQEILDRLLVLCPPAIVRLRSRLELTSC